jgi:thiol-disulfide isomerase/thioredoxin
MKLISLAVFLCSFVSIVKGQALRNLQVGDTLPPNIEVTYLSGDSVITVPLNIFYKDSYLILDFWATWCGACIKPMAEADSLSKFFDGKLQILPITYENQQTARKFIYKNKVLNKLALHFVVENTTLMGGYFKFSTIPHEVWIDTQGIVKAITYPDEITFENASLFVNNQPLHAFEKIDDLLFDITKPLKVDENSLIYRSVLINYKSGVSNAIGTFTKAFVKGEKVNRFIAINKDILSLFYAAYSQNQGHINYDRIEMHVTDSLALNPFIKGPNIGRKTIVQNSFCYELLLPNKVERNIFYTYLFEDLNRLFPFKASIEKRKKLCYVLVQRNKNKIPKTLGMQTKLIWENGQIKSLHNQTMDILVSYLNWNMDLQVIDETNFANSFDMDLEIEMINNGENIVIDFLKLNKVLKRYSFDLVKTERFVDVLVIKQH